MRQVKTIVKYFLALVLSPQERWSYLTDRTLPEAQSEHVNQHYYMPLMGFCAACMFLLRGMQGGESFNLELALKAGTAFLVAFLAGPYVAYFILKCVCYPALKAIMMSDLRVDTERERFMVFVFYAMSFDMVMTVLSTLMHNFRFFDLLYLYLFGIVWAASTPFLGVPATRRLSFSLVTTVGLFVSHWCVSWMLGLVGR